MGELRCVGRRCPFTTPDKYLALGCICRGGLERAERIQSLRRAKGEEKMLTKPEPIYDLTCAACGTPFRANRATPYGPCCTAERRRKKGKAA